MSSFFKRRSLKNSFATISGFTLVEMLIVVSIIVIISTVVLLNFPRYSANQQLQLTAQDVLTTIRETQLYGIAVRGVSTTTGSTVFKSQGVYIDLAYPVTPTPTNDFYISYIDSDHIVGAVDSSEGFSQATCTVNSIEGPCFVKNIPSPTVVSDLCVSSDGTAATERCLKTGTNNISAVDILFQRPEPEPKIWGFTPSIPNAVRDAGLSRYAKITLSVSDGDGGYLDVGTKSIYIWDTGQVSIQGESSKL